MLTTALLPFGMARRMVKEAFVWEDWSNLVDYSQRVRWAMAMRQGTTQAALASSVGASQQAIGKAANGGEGSAYTAQMAAVLGVNAYWLATGKGAPTLNLKDIPEGAVDIAIAFTHLPPPLQVDLGKELLMTALSFIPATHPRYKAIESLYLSLLSPSRTTQ